MQIAVVIPVFNGAKFLREALESVFTQTRPANEVIVVDDGSTDGGEGARIAGEFPIRLLRKPNGGQSSARNHGIAHTEADLIAFLDQDDVWAPEHLAELEAPFAADDPTCGWVYSNGDIIDGAGQVTKRHYHNGRPGEHPKRSLADCFAGDMSVLPSAALISRSALAAVGGFDERLVGHEDDDLFIRLVAAGYRSAYLPNSLTYWRHHAEQTTRSKRTISRSRGIFVRKAAAAYPEHSPTIVSWYMSTTMAAAREPIAARDREWLSEIRADLAALAPHGRAPHLASICFASWQSAYLFRKLWRLGKKVSH